MLGLPRDLRRSATIILTCFALLTVAVLFIPCSRPLSAMAA
jgi:hypothetical protein